MRFFFRAFAEIKNICVQIYTRPRISQGDFPVMRFVQHESTKMKNNSFACAWRQADRLTARLAKTSATRRKEKKRNGKSEKKKDVGSSNVIESTAAGCSIPNNQVFLWRCLPPWLAHSKSTGMVKRMGRLEWASISFKLKSFLNFCVEIYTHPRISQSDFPVMCFVSLKSTKEKNKFAFAIGIQSGLE